MLKVVYDFKALNWSVEPVEEAPKGVSPAKAVWVRTKDGRVVKIRRPSDPSLAPMEKDARGVALAFLQEMGADAVPILSSHLEREDRIEFYYQVYERSSPTPSSQQEEESSEADSENSS